MRLICFFFPLHSRRSAATGCDYIQKAKNVTARRAKTGASVLSVGRYTLVTESSQALDWGLFAPSDTTSPSPRDKVLFRLI